MGSFKSTSLECRKEAALYYIEPNTEALIRTQFSPPLSNDLFRITAFFVFIALQSKQQVRRRRRRRRLSRLVVAIPVPLETPSRDESQWARAVDLVHRSPPFPCAVWRSCPNRFSPIPYAFHPKRASVWVWQRTEIRWYWDPHWPWRQLRRPCVWGWEWFRRQTCLHTPILRLAPSPSDRRLGPWNREWRDETWFHCNIPNLPMRLNCNMIAERVCSIIQWQMCPVSMYAWVRDELEETTRRFWVSTYLRYSFRIERVSRALLWKSLSFFRCVQLFVKWKKNKN